MNFLDLLLDYSNIWNLWEHSMDSIKLDIMDFLDLLLDYSNIWNWGERFKNSIKLDMTDSTIQITFFLLVCSLLQVMSPVST